MDFLSAFPPPPVPGWLAATLSALIGAVIGLCLGSFATALSWRRPRGISIVLPPSRCPSCGTRLTALDLVPVLSWIMAGGRCRHCKSPIGSRYVLIELAAGSTGLLIGALAPSLPVALLLFLALPLATAAIVIRIEAGRHDWPLAVTSMLLVIAGGLLALFGTG